MAPVSLPCVTGAEVCSFKTLELEYEHANEQLDKHIRITHEGGSGLGSWSWLVEDSRDPQSLDIALWKVSVWQSLMHCSKLDTLY